MLDRSQHDPLKVDELTFRKCSYGKRVKSAADIDTIPIQTSAQLVSFSAVAQRSDRDVRGVWDVEPVELFKWPCVKTVMKQ